MKYIRKFNESIEENLYKKISRDEYLTKHRSSQSFIIDNCLDFTDNEVHQIKSYFIDSSNDKYKFETTQSYDYGAFKSKYMINIYHRDHDGHFILRYTIIKMKDEWYYLWNRPYNSYFECDQLDGLIDCLKNETKNTFEHNL